MRSPLLEKIPTIIKTMVADENMLYVGTSQGMLIAIPIDSLSGKELESETSSDSNVSGEINSVYHDNCALALHVQKDSRVKSLLHLQLPTKRRFESNDALPTCSETSETQQLELQTLPNIISLQDQSQSSSQSGYQSLIVSAGKGHMEYSADKDAEDIMNLPPDYSSLREKNEEHQLLVWGHKLCHGCC